MRKALLIFLLTLALAIPAPAGVKKFATPVAPSGTALAGTATYQTTYVADTLTDLTAITGQTGDIGIVITYGTGQIFVWNGVLWLPADISGSSGITIASEYTGGIQTNGPGFRDNKSSGTAVVTTVDPGGHPGIITLGTSTSSTASAFSSTEDNAMQLGNGEEYYECVLRIPTLSDGTQRFQVSAGFRDTDSTLDATDGCYWRYKDDVNSGEWEGVCYSNSSVSSTLVDSNVPVVAGTWYRLGILVNAAGTSATFYINGVQKGSAITTSIPTGAGRETGAGAGIKKTVGGTARNFDLDYQKVQITLTTAR